MKMRFEVRSFGCNIRFDVEDERNVEDQWCGNQLYASVTVQLPAHSLTFDEYMDLEDLIQFHSDLQKLYQDLQGRVFFPRDKDFQLIDKSDKLRTNPRPQDARRAATYRRVFSMPVWGNVRY